ncbi:MAG: hypothetical protein ABI968_15465, partial [Acidobacteriota bacterium]
MNTAGSAVQGDAVPDLAVRGELGLERGNFGSENEGGVLANAIERRKDLLAQRPVLFLQVEVRDLHAPRSFSPFRRAGPLARGRPLDDSTGCGER